MGEGETPFCLLLDQGKEKEAKQVLRGEVEIKTTNISVTSVMENQRLQNWRRILVLRSQSDCDMSSLYWDTVDTCFSTRELNIQDLSSRLPGCVDTSHLPTYSLDKTDQAKLARLVTVLAYNHPDLPYLPLLYPLAGLLLSQGLQEEESHDMACLLVESRVPTYLTSSRGGWGVLGAALRPLADKYAKKSLAHLLSVYGEEEISSLLSSWPWWIFEKLSLSHLVRVMDCFLFEGHKVLFRVALALLKTFHKSVTAIKKEGLVRDFSHFCSNLDTSPELLLKTAFKIPRFSKSDIQKLTVRLEMEARSSRLNKGSRSRSIEDMRGEGGCGVRAVGDSVAVKQGLATPQPVPRGGPSGGVFSVLNNLDSGIVDKKTLVSLWGLLPERMTMVTPKLAYSTDEHGTSLTTFYSRVGVFEPTIILVRNTNQEVFGAYCSTAWDERNQLDDKGVRRIYFGTGETFLFSLVEGEVVKFPWVEREGGKAGELFMSGDNTMITVGGGGGTGLYIDENLRFGRTERCETFENLPLCSVADFAVSVIEVFGFNDISW